MTTTKKFTAKEVYENMTVGTRTQNGDTYYYFKDSTPVELRDTWRDLTGEYDDYNFADLDEYYKVLYTLVSTMADYDEFSENELYNIDWRDDSNGERLMWVYNNLNRGYWYDDIKNNGADSLFAILGDMQDLSRGQFADYIFNNFLKRA